MSGEASAEFAAGRRQTLRARWVFPVAGPPIARGIVEIAGGRIAGIGTGGGPVTHDLGNVAIIPGLVNAHTHLELSDVESPLEPARPFTAWLRTVIEHRRGRPAAAAAARGVLQAGAEEARRTGTTLAGDIVSAEWTPEALPRGGLRAVAFLESLGLAPERIAPALATARKHLERASAIDAAAAPSGHYGLSPHAPYSVHPELFAGLVRLAGEFRAPLAMHLAESPAERELLERGTGEFVAFLEGLGVWRSGVFPRDAGLLDYLRPLAELERALVVHGNYLTGQEVDFLAGREGMTVVYCPRTHAFFGHAPHPWRALLARGINVAIGTDSRASNPDLSLWNELLFLRRTFPEVAPSLLLELGTLRGAQALGQDTATGSLTPGKRADLAIVELPPLDSTDPFQLLFDSWSRIRGWPGSDDRELPCGSMGASGAN